MEHWFSTLLLEHWFNWFILPIIRLLLLFATFPVAFEIFELKFLLLICLLLLLLLLFLSLLDWYSKSGLSRLRDNSRHFLYSFVIDSRRRFQYFPSSMAKLAEVVVSSRELANWHTNGRLRLLISFMPSIYSKKINNQRDQIKFKIKS